jgi:hypothetical protein
MLKAITSILKIEVSYPVYSLLVFLILIYAGVFINYYDIIYEAAINNTDIDYPLGMSFAGGAIAMVVLLMGCQFFVYLLDLKSILKKLKPKNSDEITNEILKQ